MATFYATVAGADSKNGSSWATAFGFAELMSWIVNTANAGDICYIFSGTYTMDAAYTTARDGTGDNYIQLIGVSNQDSLTPAVGDNRPLFSFDGDYALTVDDYWWVANLRFSGNAGTSTAMFRADTGAYIKNCYFNNTTTTANKVGLYCPVQYTYIFNTECISTLGIGLQTSGGYYEGLYCHDSIYGARIDTTVCQVIGSIFANCTYGIDIRIRNGGFQSYFNCTVHSCVTSGLYCQNSTATNGYLFFKNISISRCGTGLTKGTYPQNYYIDYCNWYDNTTDVSVGVVKGSHDIAVDPLYMDANNGDFRLQSGSGMINVGWVTSLGIG